MPNSCIEQQLKTIADLVRNELFAEAGAALQEFTMQELAEAHWVDAQLLRARIALETRSFGLLRDTLKQLEERHLSPKQHTQSKLLSAYGLAHCGDLRKAFRLAAKVLRAASPTSETAATSNSVLGLCCFRRGHYPWAREFFRKSAAYYRLLGSKQLLAYKLNNLALVEKAYGAVDVALRLLDEAVSILDETHSPIVFRRLLFNRAICFLHLGRIAEAKTHLKRVEDLSTASADPMMEVGLRNHLGHIERINGNYSEARRLHTSALEIARDLNSKRQVGLALEFLGELELEVGALDAAEEYLNRAHAIAKKVAPQGDLMMEVLRRRGEVNIAKGENKRATRDLEAGLRLCESRGDRREAALTQRALASIAINSKFEAAIGSVLRELHEYGDRFEYVRTVVSAMKSCEVRGIARDWLKHPVAIATGHVEQLGIELWASRLAASTNTARTIPSAVRDGTPVLESASASFQNCLRDAATAARSVHPILILGETGTGKEVIAQYIHRKSPFRSQPLLAINCAALPEALVESELFGHKKGTFTGASHDKTGLVEAAGTGTVLLDEVAELPLQMQAKLLRFLDSGEYRRVGETQVRYSKVRILAATNRDLKKATRDSRFRTDLYFRLNAFQVEVPPLRERTEDIASLAERFLTFESATSVRLTPELSEWLLTYDWPGNVRELKHICGHLAAHAWGKNVIGLENLPSRFKGSDSSITAPLRTAFERERTELERKQIAAALKASKGTIVNAAKSLGVSRNHLAKRIKELEVDRDEFLKR